MKERKRKLKPFVMPMVYALAFTALVLSLSVVDTIQNKKVSKADDNYTYVNNSIISSNVPVVKEETTEVTIKPFKSDNVEIAKKFYDTNASDEEKQNALIYYNDTYMQNSGVLYKSKDAFDVVTILDGTVIKKKKDEFLRQILLNTNTFERWLSFYRMSGAFSSQVEFFFRESRNQIATKKSTDRQTLRD